MPEYRSDNITGRLVIIAEERAKRPHQFDIECSGNQKIETTSTAVPSPVPHVCPFCPGSEEQTPAAVDTIDNSNTWQVRCVPNRYPAVTKDTGRHEVIIDTPRHIVSLADLTEYEVADMLRMYKRRIQFYRQEQRWQYVQIFKNVGAAAGASLPHSHSQLIAMPFVPPQWGQILCRTADYRSETGKCYWCSILNSEIKKKERIVEVSPHFVVLCPYVSRFAAEVEIYPSEHQAGFDETDDAGIIELARVLRRTIRRLEKMVYWMKDRMAYNIVLNTETLHHTETLYGQETAVSDSMHWYFSILPSLARAAGFEWGTGLHINPVSPEQAAQRLRTLDNE